MAKPIVIAHRGASAWRPEHTLAAYARAIADGADYVEPDLVVSRDGVLVVRHESNIALTTDVARRADFTDRRTTKTIDGRTTTGWFAEDFTFAELRTLRAIERLGSARPESRRHDGAFAIVSFAETVDFVAAEAKARGRAIGLIPELKHSTYFAELGLPLEDRLLDLIDGHEYLRTAPLEVQSFEIANLRYLRRRLGRPANVRLLQLIGDAATAPADVVSARVGPTYGAMTRPAGLAEIAGYADAIGPDIRAVIPLTVDGALGDESPLVREAHDAGLRVHAWTFRPENRFLAVDFRSNAGVDARHPVGSVDEMRRYLAAGIDAFFTDDPALGREAVDGR